MRPLPSKEKRCPLELGCQGQRTGLIFKCLHVQTAARSTCESTFENKNQTSCTFLFDLHKRCWCLMTSQNMYGMEI